MIKKHLIFIFLACANLGFADSPKEITTSVIIPCSWAHAEHLYDLLKLYESQTILPDEIVISLSEADRVAPGIIERIHGEKWAFVVKILLSNNRQYAGQNRNIACSNALGDIFLCQDADDLPHPQRVEIVKYFFTHHKVEHMLHHFAGVRSLEKYFPGLKSADTVLKTVYDPTQVPFSYVRNYKEIYPSSSHGLVTNGNVVIARHVFDKVKWGNAPRAQDVNFNRSAYNVCAYRIAVKVPLLIYRNHLSSYPFKAIEMQECDFSSFVRSISIEKQYDAEIRYLDQVESK